MSAQAARVRAPAGLRLIRYLPLSVAVTAAVTALPLAAVSLLGPARGPLAVALHVLAAVALSVVVARVLAGLWTRHERSSDLVFGDLLLWGWVRRSLAERRLDATTRELEAPTAPGDDRAGLLRRMSALLEARDPYTHGHSRRVARHAERIARGIGLSSEQVAKIRAAALVHDIGKINVPRPILTKPGRLTDAEFALVKRHAGDGAAMVGSLGDPELAAIVRHHHERMDGSGYPDGLAGGDIPVGARVIAVADTFDAITSARAYRKPRTHRQAIEILQRQAGTQLDAIAVAAFVSYYAARGSIGFATVLAAAPLRVLSGLGGVQSGVASGVAPIAQTACGVGGVALIGACLGGPALPASRGVTAERDSAHRQFAAQTSHPAELRGSPRHGRETARRSQGRAAGPVTHGDAQEWTAPPSQGAAPRPLRIPVTSTPEAGEPNTGGGDAGGGGDGETVPPLPTTPEPPALPDVPSVLQTVTDTLQLSPVELPVPVPSLGAPTD